MPRLRKAVIPKNIHNHAGEASLHVKYHPVSPRRTCVAAQEKRKGFIFTRDHNVYKRLRISAVARPDDKTARAQHYYFALEVGAKSVAAQE